MGAVALQAQQASAVGEPKRQAHFSIGERKLDDAWTLTDEEGTGSIAYERNVTVHVHLNSGATGTISVDSDL